MEGAGMFAPEKGGCRKRHIESLHTVKGRRGVKTMWTKPRFTEISLCAEVTAYVYAK